MQARVQLSVRGHACARARECVPRECVARPALSLAQGGQGWQRPVYFEHAPPPPPLLRRRYFDAVVNNAKGQPVTIRKAVCMHEEDASIAWKQLDYRTGEARRGGCRCCPPCLLTNLLMPAGGRGGRRICSLCLNAVLAAHPYRTPGGAPPAPPGRLLLGHHRQLQLRLLLVPGPGRHHLLRVQADRWARGQARGVWRELTQAAAPC